MRNVTPLSNNRFMAESKSFLFSNAVRVLSTAARGAGYEVPSFKGPPNLGEHSRTLKRNSDGSVTISVVFRGRAWLSTLSDIVEGFGAGLRCDTQEDGLLISLKCRDKDANCDENFQIVKANIKNKLKESCFNISNMLKR